MPDTEALIERLAVENPEFRMLREEHQGYETELTDLNRRGFLSASPRPGRLAWWTCPPRQRRSVRRSLGSP